MSIVKAENARKDIPLVSIIAVCYNHEKYVRETLDSILNQTYKNIELVVIDANSTDNSVEIIDRWIFSNKVECIFIKQKKPKNFSQNLNEGLNLISGKYFQGIACDDIMLPGKIKNQVDVLSSSNEEVALVCSNYMGIDECGEIIFRKYYDDDYTLPKDVFIAILNGYNNYKIIIHSPTVLIKTDVIIDVGKYDEKYIQEDLYMWLKIASIYKVIYIPDISVKYRILQNSLSRNEQLKQKMIIDNILVSCYFLKTLKSKKYFYPLESRIKWNISLLVKKKFPDINKVALNFNLSYLSRDALSVINDKEQILILLDDLAKTKISLKFVKFLFIKLYMKMKAKVMMTLLLSLL